MSYLDILIERREIAEMLVKECRLARDKKESLPQGEEREKLTWILEGLLIATDLVLKR